MSDVVSVPADENVAALRRAVEHLNATRDFAWDLYTPDVVFSTRGEFGGRDTYEGHDGLERAMSAFRSVWGDSIAFEIRDISGGPEAYVLVLHFHLRGEQSGVELELDEGWAAWMREGRIARIEQYGTRQEAAEAAGLPSSP